MHTIEPHYSWLQYYDPIRDPGSPFYGITRSETECHATIYNYYIHPQWDEIGSPTLYVKLIYVNYEKHLAVIELMGEWNDILHNDCMFLKRNLADPLIAQGIRFFILIGENVLNFHSGDDDYYAEWTDETEDGWIALINIRDHVLYEFEHARLGRYLMMGKAFNDVKWRTLHPLQLAIWVNSQFPRRLKGMD